MTHASSGLRVLAGLTLFALAVLVYVPAFQCGFLFDDDVFLTENPLIAASDGLQRFWFGTEPPDYFPLTSTTLWLEWRLWGADPTGYHVVNVLLHAASCVVLWRVLLRLEVPGAWLAAALFAVHPVNVESVAWITQRKNTLPLVFYLFALQAYLRSEESEPPARGRWYAAALLSFVLALLAKTSVVVLPPVLLLCAWWRRGRVTAADLRRTAPFFAASALLGLVTVWYQTVNAIGDEVVRDDGFVSRLALAARALWFYLWKALLPLELCFVYPRWETGISGWRSFVPLALLAACFAVMWRFRRGWSRPFLFAAGYYVLALLPVLGFLDISFMEFSLVADHYQYLALIGVAALVAAGATRMPAKPRWLAATLALALLAALTWQRQAAYRDLDALWTDTLERNPRAWVAHNNLGVVRHGQGRFDDAMAHYAAALELDPDYAGAHYNLGDTLQVLGRFDEAIAHYEAALRLDPDYASAHLNLGNAHHARGRIQDAIHHYQRALELEPDRVDAHYDLANSLQQLGRFGDAASHYALALQLEPDNVYVLNRCAWLLVTCPDDSVRDERRAIELAERAVHLAGDERAVPLHTLAAAHAATGNFAEAVRWQEQAVDVASPDQRDALRRMLDTYRRGARLDVERRGPTDG